MPIQYKELGIEHLAHFNDIQEKNHDKPVWWVVAQAIKRFEIMNGERPLGGGAR